MFRGLVKPGESLSVVLRLAPSFFSKVAQLIFGVGVAVAGSAEIPGRGLSKVLLHAIPALVKVAELLFRLPEIVVGRFAVPVKGFLVITLDAHTILEHRSQLVFCERIALLRCGTIVVQSALVIPHHAPLMMLLAAHMSL